MKNLGNFDNKNGRLPSFFQELIIAYIKNTRVNEYLASVLQDILSHYLHNEASDNSASNDTDQEMQFITRVLQRITSSAASLPYGIRRIARKLYEVGQSLQWTEEEIMNSFIRDLIMNTFFIPCLLSPDVYASIHTGFETSNEVLAKMSKAAVYCRSITTETNAELKRYFEKIVQNSFSQELNDVTIDVSSTSQMDAELCSIIYLRKSDVDLLVQLFTTTPQLSDWTVLKKVITLMNDTDAFKKTNDNALLSLDLNYVQPDYPRPSAPPSEHPVVKEVKKKLFHILSQLSQLHGVTSNATLMEILEGQHKYWNKDAPSLMAQTHETVRCLNELPSNYSEDNYKLIVDQMTAESTVRINSSTENKLRVMQLLELSQLVIHKLTLQRNMLLQYCVKMKLSSFRQNVFVKERDVFKERFLQKHSNDKGKGCGCSVLEDITCDFCNMKSIEIKTFMSGIEQKLALENSMNNEEEIKIAVKQLEQNLMGILYNDIFVSILEDLVLSSKIRVSSKLQPEHLRVPNKFLADAPWPFAQAELQKISAFRAPYDKFLCISRCWEIINSCVSMLDEPGPDACWTIMAFVVHAVNVKDLLSHVHYINLYTALDEKEAARMMAFTSSILALLEVMKDQGIRSSN